MLERQAVFTRATAVLRILAPLVPHRSVALFFSNMAVLLQTGVNVLRAMEILEDQEDSPAFQAVLRQVRRAVHQGNPLSRAMAMCMPPFTPMQVGMVRAGEQGGHMPRVMQRLAHIGEKEIALTARLRAICTYPALVLGFSVVIMASVSQVMVSSFVPVLTSFGAQLPLLTRVLVWLSSPLGIVLTLLGLSGLAFFALQWAHTHQGRHTLGDLSFSLPLLGPAMLRVELSRALRMLGALYNSGVPILQALEMVVETTGHPTMRRCLLQAASRLKEGIPLARALQGVDRFPVAVSHFAKVGEESGQLAPMMDKLSDFYEFEVENALDRLAAALEPLLIAGMGVVVGIIVIVAFAPMLQLVAKLG